MLILSAPDLRSPSQRCLHTFRIFHQLPLRPLHGSQALYRFREQGYVRRFQARQPLFELLPELPDFSRRLFICDTDIFQKLRIDLHLSRKCAERLFFSRITSIIKSEVRMPSPVLACLLKMIWPDCSPPRI